MSTMAQVRLELAAEDLKKATHGSASVHNMSPHTFLLVGLELEEQQYVSPLGCFSTNLILDRRILKEHVQPKLSTLQEAAVNERRAALHRRILNWQHIQTFYMPAVSKLRANQFIEDSSITPTEDIPLYLPSGCHTLTVIPDDLLAMEKRIRVAQAEDALVELRRLLRISSGLWQYKRTQIGPSQRAGTRARSLISRFTDKVNHSANRYRAARHALLALDAGGEWAQRLRELKAEHVKGPRRDDNDESEGRRELSWIWMIRSQVEVNDLTAEELGESE